jgi:hypothetical protein
MKADSLIHRKVAAHEAELERERESRDADQIAIGQNTSSQAQRGGSAKTIICSTRPAIQSSNTSSTRQETIIAKTGTEPDKPAPSLSKYGYEPRFFSPPFDSKSTLRGVEEFIRAAAHITGPAQQTNHSRWETPQFTSRFYLVRPWTNQRMRLKLMIVEAHTASPYLI